MSEYPIKNFITDEDGRVIYTYLNELMIPFRDAISPDDAQGLTLEELEAEADKRYASHLDAIENPVEPPVPEPEERLTAIEAEIQQQKDTLAALLAEKALIEIELAEE